MFTTLPTLFNDQIDIKYDGNLREFARQMDLPATDYERLRAFLNENRTPRTEFLIQLAEFLRIDTTRVLLLADITRAQKSGDIKELKYRTELYTKHMNPPQGKTRGTPVFLSTKGDFIDWKTGRADDTQAHRMIYIPSKDPLAFWISAMGPDQTGPGVNADDLLLVEPSEKVESGNLVACHYRGCGLCVRYFHTDNNLLIFNDLSPNGKICVHKTGDHVYYYKIAFIAKAT